MASTADSEHQFKDIDLNISLTTNNHAGALIGHAVGAVNIDGVDITTTIGFCCYRLKR